MIIEITALVLVLIGALLCLTAAIGLLRFRDVPSRIHAATKPQVLGLVLIAIGVEVALQTWVAAAFLAPMVIIQLATAPLSAHMAGRQAYRNHRLDGSHLARDELDDDREVLEDEG